MKKDILITPTPVSGYPTIQFSGSSGSTMWLEVHDNGSLLYNGTTSGNVVRIDDSITGISFSVILPSDVPFFYVNGDSNTIGEGDSSSFLIDGINVKFGTSLTSNRPFYVENEVSKVPAEFCHFLRLSSSASV